MAATGQLVVFSLGGEEYALPIATVSEISRHATPRAVASDAPGVIGLRGKVIPVIDLTARLAYRPCRSRRTTAAKSSSSTPRPASWASWSTTLTRC